MILNWRLVREKLTTQTLSKLKFSPFQNILLILKDRLQIENILKYIFISKILRTS